MKNLILVLVVITVFVLGCAPPRESNNDLIPVKMAGNSSSMPYAPATPRWDYVDKTDPMTSKPVKLAKLESTNTLNFDSPYDGGSTGTLAIRRMNGKEDVMLSISKGQFLGNISDRRRVNLRFDDQKAFTVSYNEPNDSSADMIFLESSSKIISELKKASRLKLQVEFYQEGANILEFDVKDFKWDR